MASSTRKLREKVEKTYVDDGFDDEIEGKRNFDVDEKVNSDIYNADLVLEMSGSEVTVDHFQRSGHKYPIVIHEKTGLGLRTPSEQFRVSDVKKCVGSRRMLDVMDVETQRGMEMSLRDWEEYYENPHRERLLNVISLEFSHTRLDQYVDAPKTVREVDFINAAWPPHLKECHTESTNILDKMFYPKVQKYCLMSVGNCYTDFHVDFGGTSVWYHILRGQKIFWLIEPTDENLELYVEWVLSGKQGDVFFGDKVSQCQKINLYQGDTFLIPSGWIHGVFTPIDSLVFGGNFLHAYNLSQQLKVAAIEDRTRVPGKFRFPFFTEMMWYVIAQYVRCLTGFNHFIPPEDQEGAARIKNSKITNDTVHLTPYEIGGLHEVVEWLENLPPNKKAIPKDLDDVATLLERIKDVLISHEDDDPELAVTGNCPITWPEVIKKVKKPSYKSTSKDPKSPKIINVNRRRRTRCKKCEACSRDDCEECVFCSDMKKFGGPGRMKQSCKSRQCMAPTLPASAHCHLCGETSNEGDVDINYSQLLMECGICWDITHPACLLAKFPEYLDTEGRLNDVLPNSWECPKCCSEGKAGQTRARVIKGGGAPGRQRHKSKSSNGDMDEERSLDDPEDVSFTNNKKQIDNTPLRYDDIEQLMQRGTDEDRLHYDDSDEDDKEDTTDILLLLENTMDRPTDLDHPYTMKSDDEGSPTRKPTLTIETSSNGTKKTVKPEDIESKIDSIATHSVKITPKVLSESKHNGENKNIQKATVTKRKVDNKATVVVKSDTSTVKNTTPKVETLTERLKVDVDSSVHKKYQRKSTTLIHEGKRVTMHGKRVLDDDGMDIKGVSTSGVSESRQAVVKLVRDRDVMPILERIGGETELVKAESSQNKMPLITTTTTSSSKLSPVNLKSSSDSDSEVSTKRPRREKTVPKRYLE